MEIEESHSAHMDGYRPHEPLLPHLTYHEGIGIPLPGGLIVVISSQDAEGRHNLRRLGHQKRPNPGSHALLLTKQSLLGQP